MKKLLEKIFKIKYIEKKIDETTKRLREEREAAEEAAKKAEEDLEKLNNISKLFDKFDEEHKDLIEACARVKEERMKKC